MSILFSLFFSKQKAPSHTAGRGFLDSEIHYGTRQYMPLVASVPQLIIVPIAAELVVDVQEKPVVDKLAASSSPFKA